MLSHCLAQVRRLRGVLPAASAARAERCLRYAELTRVLRSQVRSHGSDHARALGAWREPTELLGVGLHRLTCRWLEIDLRPHRTRNAAEGVYGRVGVGTFELGYRWLAHARELRVLGLSAADDVAPHPAIQLDAH